MLFAGIAKAFDPQNFSRYLQKLWLPSTRLSTSATVTLVAAQCGVGTSLILGLGLRWLIPVTILLLTIFAAVSCWGLATGRSADCGCYNSVLTFSPLLSIILEICYIALLLLSWQWGVNAESFELWKAAVSLLIASSASILAYASFRYSAKHRRPLIEMSPLKAGRRWNPRWLDGTPASSAASGKKIAVFLGVNCYSCKLWIKVLNVVHSLPGLPEVIGAVPLAKSSIEIFAEKENIRFPVVTAKPWVIARLVRNFTPTAVVIEDGIIRGKWVGTMPKSFVNQIRRAMRKDKANPADASSTSTTATTS